MARTHSTHTTCFCTFWVSVSREEVCAQQTYAFHAPLAAHVMLPIKRGTPSGVNSSNASTPPKTDQICAEQDHALVWMIAAGVHEFGDGVLLSPLVQRTRRRPALTRRLVLHKRHSHSHSHSPITITASCTCQCIVMLPVHLPQSVPPAAPARTGLSPVTAASLTIFYATLTPLAAARMPHKCPHATQTAPQQLNCC